MKLSAEWRGRLSLHILSLREDLAKPLHSILSLQGYRVQILTEPAPKPPPHLVFVDLVSFPTLEAAITPYNQVSDEVLFVIIAPLGLSAKFEEYREFGVYFTLPYQEGFDWAAVQVADLVATEWILKTRLEALEEQRKTLEEDCRSQLLAKDEEREKQKAEWNELAQSLRQQAEMLQAQLQEENRRYQEEKGRWELEQRQYQHHNQQMAWFLEGLGHPKPWLEGGAAAAVEHWFHQLEALRHWPKLGTICYFRFLPEVQSFSPWRIWSHPELADDVTKHSAFRPEVSPAEWVQLHPQELFESLSEYLKKEWPKLQGPWQIVPLSYPHAIEGVVMIHWLPEVSELLKRKMQVLLEDLRLWVAYQSLFSLYQSKWNEIDPETGFDKRDRYHAKLDEEFRRAQRLNDPLSILKLGLDHYQEIRDAYGEKTLKLIWKQLGSLLKKAGRVHDLYYRTEENEITILLPHTPVEGAVIMAERLRRLVDQSEFEFYPPKYLSISIGVSGYPQLVSSSEVLDTSAKEALELVMSQGLNQVCLYTPPSGDEGRREL
jgi:diguanylate cyclase (GGDEF)-like protein